MGSGASPPQFSGSFVAKRRQNDPDSMRHQGLQEPADRHQGLAQHPNSLPAPDFFQFSSVQNLQFHLIPFLYTTWSRTGFSAHGFLIWVNYNISLT